MMDFETIKQVFDGSFDNGSYVKITELFEETTSGIESEQPTIVNKKRINTIFSK